MANKQRFITVPTINWIPAMSMFGPIVTPRYVSENTAYDLVRSGFTVVEHAASGKYAGSKVELTIQNFYDENRFASDTGNTVINKVDKNLGAAVNGQARAVDPMAKDAQIPISTVESESEAVAVIPNTASPIANAMSKSQRKKAAKEAARAAAAAKAAASESTEEEEIIPDPSTPIETTETETSPENETAEE